MYAHRTACQWLILLAALLAACSTEIDKLHEETDCTTTVRGEITHERCLIDRSSLNHRIGM